MHKIAICWLEVHPVKGDEHNKEHSTTNKTKAQEQWCYKYIMYRIKKCS